MPFAVSSLSFTGGAVRLMNALPADFGIEIFYEWGGTSYWNTFLQRAMAQRDGGFSVHSPFGYCDFAATESDEELFSFMREPFSLYHRFGGTHYVVHTDGRLPRDLTADDRKRFRERVSRRLSAFAHICREEGVALVIENVINSAPPLFDEEQYLRLFAENPQLNAIIDTGHAHLAGFDIGRVQRTLGARIKAYHIHDNAGDADTHLPVLTDIKGGIDWEQFAQNVVRHTPDAVLTFEYGQGFADVFVRDRERLSALMKPHPSNEYPPKNERQ